ncbi:MAG TPA: hypothetical protein VFZ09_31310 [Archangium sp.]|uniref:hypothetical protein n=1 Tax=Archangium sp. TaxID=1872627 RepID=UPI002E362DD6|nr:hypothetical protein [Archangium sp.]HEX5750756.1 hypothetical protein [Archangium sp.]
MRLRSLVVAVVLSSGCQQPARPEPTAALEQSPGSGENTDAQAPLPETPTTAEPIPAEALPSPAEELPEQSWSARSADGNAEVQQTAFRDGKALRCTSTSTWSSPWDDRKVVWKWDTCIATREQLKFVSPDGKRVLVIDPLLASLRAGTRWQDVEVATLHEHGVRVKGAKAGALLHAPLEVREPALRILWVKGLGGFPGAPPRYASDGKAVELDMVDGNTLHLGFDGDGFPAAPEDKQAFNASTGMYRYEDEKGTVHFVSSSSEVPDAYRSRAVPVEAQLLTVRGPLGLGESPASKPGPESQPPPVENKEPSPEKVLESARLASPAELLQRARDTVKQVEEVQRTREHLADSLLSGAPAPAQPASEAGKNPNPARPLENARIPTPEELLERAREAVKKVEEVHRVQETPHP